ncbi:uncharacterized protein Dana_GF17421 [Drosophila ananassae]|uniref:CHK kinase-like domain-containing protein n=1 Tax=Drosophila ananassae TaxID=7217 RepID=B3LWL8_DROAN|nr:uncharacterized protein LOC6500205 [Drosophila ananassae]EDV41612.1 uncharacterized protein Dana_GF17421 [Drosophila ananassae]
MPSKPVNPNEFLLIPKWINEDYFVPILEKDMGNFEKIVSFLPIAATAPGENYTSIMVRVVIVYLSKDGSKEDVSYILKTGLDVNKGGAMVEQIGMFPREKEMYQHHIPLFGKLYKEAGIEVELAPKCVHIEETPERITMVFEDLKRKNFRNIDRLKGLDLPHMRCVLRKLAELHAASAVYREINGPYDTKYSKNMFSEENRELLTKVREFREPQYQKAMLEWGIPDIERYIKKSPSATKFIEETLRLNKADEKSFNVLNHGDSWCNNIMFKYKENGEVDSTLFVDLQLCKWGSPAQDLWYVIVSSASLDIKVKEFDHFIKIYHERLSECLNLLNYSKPVPTLRDVHVMMIKGGTWGYVTANGVMVAVLMPSDKDSNMDKMLSPGPESDAFRHKTFTNPLYVKAMKQLLPFFDQRGVLDFD